MECHIGIFFKKQSLISNDGFEFKPCLSSQMSSLDKKSMNEFEDENLFSPETDAQKTQPIQVVEQRSFPGRLQANGDKMRRTVIFRSIKTVVFSNKLNLLIPFGPLAILVNKLTGHHVSSSSPLSYSG